MNTILDWPPVELDRYLVKCESVVAGPGPGEVSVKFLDCEGTVVSVIVHESQVSGPFLITSRPVDVDGSEGSFVLVELPREADSGTWRVWVDRDLDWEAVEVVMTR